MKAFELSDLANSAYKAGLKSKYPEMTDEALQQLFLEKRLKCHNRNY